MSDRPPVPADSFPHAIAARVRERIELSTRSIPPGASTLADNHRETLTRFSKWVIDLDLNDGRLWNLYAVHGILGGGDVYEPGREQAGVLSTAGEGVDIAEPHDVADDLIRAGLDDIQGELRKRGQKASELVATAERLDKTRTELAKVESELADERRALTEARAEAGDYRQRYQYLLEQQVAASSAPAAEPKEPARRTKVDGHKGVYVTPAGSYEICWTENGRQRWLVVGPDLDAAVSARAEKLTPKEPASV